MFTDIVHQRFNRPIFEPADYGRGNTRNSTLVVTGFAYHLNDLVMLNVVGINANIDSLITTAKTKAHINILSVQTPEGRRNLGRRANDEFRFDRKEILGYGITSLLITSMEVLRPSSERNFFAANTLDDAVRMVGERIRASVNVSVLDAWYPYLFGIACSEAKIRDLPGHGIVAYHLDTEPAFWSSAISSGLASNLINFGEE